MKRINNFHYGIAAHVEYEYYSGNWGLYLRIWKDIRIQWRIYQLKDLNILIPSLRCE